MFSYIKKFVFVAICVFIFYNIYLSSALVRQGEVRISNDVGRDFLLLQELDQKKIVLIGARTNVQNVFHGSLWTYLNYPAYLIGHGNPVAMAWFWVILGIVFLLTTFILVKKLFGVLPALLATLLLSIDLIPRSNSLFGQLGGFYFMPVFLYTIYQYLQTKKAYFLIAHFIILGILINLNIGNGTLFLFLSIILVLIFIIKNKLWKHLCLFIFIPISVLNYILFDVRHNFNMARALLNMSGSSKFAIPLKEWLLIRFDSTISMQLLLTNFWIYAIIFILIMFFTLLAIKQKKKGKNFLLLLTFYYFGYMILTYFNKGVILIDHVYLLIPLTVIWIAALIKISYKIIFIPLILIVIYLNFNSVNSNINSFTYSIGRSQDSWISLKNVAQTIIDKEKGKEFGYFVYSPDAFAYQQRYAMRYAFKAAKAKADEYVKMRTTFVIESPRPANNQYMGPNWWVENKANIKSNPVWNLNFPSGYIIKEFNLTPEEQKIPFEQNIKLELNFR